MKVGNFIKFAAFILTLVQVVDLGCSKSTNSDGTPHGSISNITDCGQFAAKLNDDQEIPCCSCADYEYMGGTLYITHSGAGFNCCADIDADIAIDGNTITIKEKESGEACHCLCLYQVKYKITNLPTGEYTVRFIELYLNDADDLLETSINVETAPTGEFCVERGHYPWGTE